MAASRMSVRRSQPRLWSPRSQSMISRSAGEQRIVRFSVNSFMSPNKKPRCLTVKDYCDTTKDYPLADKLSCMAGDQTTIRLDPRIKRTLERLVQEKSYPSLTAFITDAILLKFDIEGITVEGMEPEPDALERYFATPAGEQLLSRLIRQELESLSTRERSS